MLIAYVNIWRSSSTPGTISASGPLTEWLLSGLHLEKRALQSRFSCADVSGTFGLGLGGDLTPALCPGSPLALRIESSPRRHLLRERQYLTVVDSCHAVVGSVTFAPFAEHL